MDSILFKLNFILAAHPWIGGIIVAIWYRFFYVRALPFVIIVCFGFFISLIAPIFLGDSYGLLSILICMFGWNRLKKNDEEYDEEDDDNNVIQN